MLLNYASEVDKDDLAEEDTKVKIGIRIGMIIFFFVIKIYILFY